MPLPKASRQEFRDLVSVIRPCPAHSPCCENSLLPHVLLRLSQHVPVFLFSVRGVHASLPAVPNAHLFPPRPTRWASHPRSRIELRLVQSPRALTLPSQGTVPRPRLARALSGSDPSSLPDSGFWIWRDGPLRASQLGSHPPPRPHGPPGHPCSLGTLVVSGDSSVCVRRTVWVSSCRGWVRGLP